MGIKVNRVVATAFAIGAGLAAVAGFLYAVQAGQINPYMGFTPVLKAFIAAVIGGFGSIAGAVLGGYVLGFLEVLVTALAGIGDLLPPGSVPPEVRELPPDGAAELASRSYRDAVVFVVLILVLLVRPQGILGRREPEDDAVSDDVALRRAAGPLPRDRPVVDRARRPRRERPGVLAGPRDQPRRSSSS